MVERSLVDTVDNRDEPSSDPKWEFLLRCCIVINL